MRLPSLALDFHSIPVKIQEERFRNMRTLEQQVLTLVRRAGILRARELDKRHLPRMCLRRLEQKGLIQRISRGLYVPAGGKPVAHQALAEATKLLRGGIVCLLSALHFHGLLADEPPEVWVALAPGRFCPRRGRPPIRAIRLSKRRRIRDYEDHEIAGVHIQVYSPARTIAECFRFRRKIGNDTAIAALHAYRRSPHWNPTELVKAASVCRVTRILQPYLDALRLVPPASDSPEAPFASISGHLEAAVAERFNRVMSQSIEAVRMDAFWDLWLLSQHFTLDGRTLRRAIIPLFDHSGTALPLHPPPTLREDFYENPAVLARWAAFAETRPPAKEVPLRRIIDRIYDFLWPLEQAIICLEPFFCRWLPGGPWVQLKMPKRS